MVDVPGFGRLVLDPGPDGLSPWRLDRPAASELYPESVAVNVMLEGAEDLGQVDLVLVADVLANLDDHIGRGLNFVRDRLLTDPAFFGLTPADVESYGDLTVDDFPLDSPQLNFYPGTEWVLHFQRGRLPLCEPYGLGVVFDRHQPVRIDDLTEVEPIE